jgi:hypothetical protein
MSHVNSANSTEPRVYYHTGVFTIKAKIPLGFGLLVGVTALVGGGLGYLHAFHGLDLGLFNVLTTSMIEGLAIGGGGVLIAMAIATVVLTVKRSRMRQILMSAWKCAGLIDWRDQLGLLLQKGGGRGHTKTEIVQLEPDFRPSSCYNKYIDETGERAYAVLKGNNTVHVFPDKSSSDAYEARQGVLKDPATV